MRNEFEVGTLVWYNDDAPIEPLLGVLWLVISKELNDDSRDAEDWPTVWTLQRGGIGTQVFVADYLHALIPNTVHSNTDIAIQMGRCGAGGI